MLSQRWCVRSWHRCNLPSLSNTPGDMYGSPSDFAHSNMEKELIMNMRELIRNKLDGLVPDDLLRIINRTSTFRRLPAQSSLARHPQ
jgi:hypothetical protein